ncbi:flagellar hook protein FlgE [Polymorphum gilvum]|uniref:Flagellar hook protein FlgE n=1 Tax=Polymorphum gilvum (strain LMG 25793 / CGMCC 1.9160 / SL003B-26A1) TaxID=991905 RepID=F2J4P3_POLGS|nr:flagellar hook protein FlgE [Polymorphum gilvum]ADZ72295.1 Flagellar basal body FlaE [Polymorphum gilvum SL003B-26A1]
MSLYGVMRTGVSGMNAQSSKLGTVADNIANSSTTGYKRAASEFSSMILSQGTGTYNSGGVKAHTVYAISQQGAISYTTSGLDLAIDGNGFFVVADREGSTALTRAGSFVVDSKGYLVNTAGYYLQGYPIGNGGTVAPVANGLGGLENVNVSQSKLEAVPTDSALLWANVPEDAAIVAAADLPSANAATATYSAKTSLIVYDNLGNAVTLDIYYSKATETAADSDWEVTIYNADDAAPGGGFPYGAPALATQTITFDRTTGNLAAASPTDITVAVPNGSTFDLDMSGMTYLNADFTITEVDANGNAPSAVESVEFADDGTLFAVYANGDRRALYRIPLADVPSPDKLTPLSGNIYTVSNNSGEVRVGFPGEGGLGSLTVGALESSNVDLASELTSMIESQRGYTANSKVFKAGSDLLEELVNLVR